MAVISWDNYVDDATVTSSSTGATASPITATETISEQKLLTRQIGDVMRWTFTASDSFWIDFDLGSAKATNLFCVLNHTMQGLAYTVKFGTTQGASDVATESGTFAAATSYDANNDMLSFTDHTARWVRLTVTITGALILSIGRIWIDDAWTTNVGMDFNMGVVDRSTKTKSRGGSAYVSSRQKLRKMDVNAIGRTTADFIGTSSDFDSFLTMDLAVGESGEIVCLPLTDSAHNRNRLGIYGTISNNGPIQVKDKGASGYLTTKRFTIEEDRG